MPVLRTTGRVTLKNVALSCGYSANTVSRALRGDERLPDATREQIVRTARDMGYIPNSSARTLRRGNSRTIAVVINDINNPYYTNIVSEIDHCLSETEYRMMILPCRDDEETAGKMIELAISQCVDGIMFFPYNNKAHILQLQQSCIPFVLMDRWLSGVEANMVRLDDEAGGYAAAEYLLRLGHRRILYIAGPNVNSSQIDRQMGIRRAFSDFGLGRDALSTLPWEMLPGGIKTTDYHALFNPADFSAVIAYNDYIAYHCMNDLRAQGVRIPEDLAMIGFDHIRRYNSCFPPLCSISAADQSVAEVAVRLLMEHMLNPRLPKREIVLPVAIQPGGTV